MKYVIGGVVATVVGFVWALCKAASDADDAQEREAKEWAENRIRWQREQP